MPCCTLCSIITITVIWYKYSYIIAAIFASKNLINEKWGENKLVKDLKDMSFNLHKNALDLENIFNVPLSSKVGYEKIYWLSRWTC